MTPLRREVRVERLLGQTRQRRLGAAITQGDDGDPRKHRGLLHGREQVLERGGRVVGVVGRVVNDDRRPGATACAHSTSSEASPTMSRFCVVTPFWSTIWKLGGAGIPKNWSNVVQIGPERGVDSLLDDGDRLAGTVAGDGRAAGAGEADLVDAVGVAKLRGADLAAEERQLAGERIGIRVGVDKRFEFASVNAR